MRFARLSVIIFCLLALFGCNGGTVVTTPTNPTETIKTVQFNSGSYKISGQVPATWDVKEYGPGVPLGPEVLPDIDDPSTIVIATFVRNQTDNFTFYYADLPPGKTFEAFIRDRHPTDPIEITSDTTNPPDTNIRLSSFNEGVVGPHGGSIIEIYLYTISENNVVWMRGELFGDQQHRNQVADELDKTLSTFKFSQ